jgi:GT2 family glycosyltransferase
MSLAVLVLNFNGRHLLAECLPSVLRAAAASRHDARVMVIDNGSSDDSRDYLAAAHPQVAIIDRPNLGLTSYNSVLAELDCRVALLVNNDVKLAEDCIDPLVDPLVCDPQPNDRCFLTAPRCCKFDGLTYEGLKTAVGWRLGLVQATCFYKGFQQDSQRPGWTANAGPVMAVDRQIFLQLGGFDPLYLPGRLEDLDFVFRGYLAGYHARYVPDALAYHLGGASFSRALDREGCDRLALRNTLLFQWKNLRYPVHIARHAAGLAIRLAVEPLRAWRSPPARRWQLVDALRAAIIRHRQMAHTSAPPLGLERVLREREYFRRFRASRLAAAEAKPQRPLPVPWLENMSIISSRKAE